MTRRNIVSVSWADHLTFGEGDGRLMKPSAVGTRILRWREDLRARTLHWRVPRTALDGVFHAAPGREHPTLKGFRDVNWDSLKVVPELAHEQCLDAYLYVSIFDEGWPLAPVKERVVSYHNAMHGQHVSWQSRFSADHPEYAVVDRMGTVHQWGVLCLAYPEVRQHFVGRFLELLNGGDWDGLFVCFRSQSRPADYADQFGFNDPVRHDFSDRFGVDIRAQEFDVQAWRNLLGSYVTQFLELLRGALESRGLRLSVGCALGNVVGHPLGNATLEWRSWVSEGLIDELVVNHNSSRCPSMWHQLWPMHEGTGYIEDRRDATLTALDGLLTREYEPEIKSSNTSLFMARQWDNFSPMVESWLVSHAVVTGLVFSSFRYDNPGPISRGVWRA